MKSNSFDVEQPTELNSELTETEQNVEIDELLPTEEEELEFVPNQVIVKFKDNVSTANISTLQSTLDAEVLGKIPSLGMQLWETPETEVANVMATYSTDPNIEYIVPNYKRDLAQTFPDDSSFDQLWGLHNTGQTGGTNDADIDAPEAWDITTGSANNVVVGVIDSGIDYTHPDLAANIWTNPGEIPDNGEDDDGNGYVDDVHGYDFSDFDSDPMDVDGHGTHVAGTIGAVGDNNEGVVGVNWSPQLMAIKIFPNAFDFNIIQAIEYTANMGVPITNNSWGGGPPSQALEDAIAYAGEAGQLFVAAAGNYSNDNDDFAFYPASYDLENILSVAATDHNDELAYFSNYGATTVDLGAPGVDVYSTVPYGDGYDFLSGTSMATPHVVGAASLLLSENPDLDAVQLKNQLMVSADPIPALDGLTVSGGRLNAYQALISPVAGQIKGSKWHDLDQNGDWDADEPGLSGWTIYLDENNNGELDEGENSTVTNSAGDYIFNFLTPGTYTVAEVLKPGWEQTHPTDPETYSVDVAEEETVTDINFGNILSEPASISGSKWHDLDQDGVWDDDEPALEGWTIYLDQNENGQLDEEELSTVTDDDGKYEFSDLSPDIYTVAEVLQQGWEQTSPVDGTYILDLAPNEAAEEIDFGNFELPPGEIGGSKWNDLNGNGERDPEEPGLEGWTIYLDDNNNGELDEGERSTVTDENGEYTFSDLPTGRYIVAEVLQETWQQTYPSSGQVFSDPLGDFFGFSDPQLDIESVSAALRGETLSLTMNFFTPIAAPSENLPESVVGFWDLDLDQDAATGVPANQTFFAPPDQQGGPLGVEVFVDLFSESFQPGFVDLVDAVNFSYIATVPIAYESDSFEIQVPLSLLGDDGAVNYGTIAGTLFEPTDAAPNTEFGTLGDAASTKSEPNTEILSNRLWEGLSIASSETENRSTVVEFNADLATSAFPHYVELEPGQLISDLDFGNWQPITLSGQKWYDVDGDGELDNDEEGLEGWTIYLDDNNNGELDDDETFTITDEEGNYSFTLPEGSYTVAEVPQEGWEQTAPADGTYEVSLAAGESEENLNFGNQALPGEISGSKWHDLNGNGDRDPDEPGLEGWTIYLDTNENGELDEDERSTVTDENGEYVFDNVPIGRYIVAEVLQENWEQTYPLGFVNEPTQLTDNDFYEYSPQISGNNVVWFGEDENYYPDVYFYDGEEVTQLTDNSFYEYGLQIDGDNVVWIGEGENFNPEVYFYDGEEVTQLTDNDTYESSPQISGNNVVWSAWDGSDEEIFLYDGSEVIQITDNNFSDYSPQISGNNVVWSAYDGNDNEIFFYDGDTITQLTDNDFYEYNPQISGNNIVWNGEDENYNSEIYFYDGEDVTQLTDNDFYESNTQIDGNNVVWSAWDGNDEEIYFYDGNTITQVTDNNWGDYSPQIDGNNVVWSAYDGFDEEIYFYDGEAITQVTDNNVYDYNPQISENNIVWSGNDEFNFDSEIYLISQGNTHSVNLEPGETVSNLDFGNWQPGTLSGTKWYDVDGDGEFDNDEVGLEGWTIFLDHNNNGELDESETSTVTDAEGNYSFELSEGTYTVAEVLQPGWVQTTPEDGSYTVSLAAGDDLSGFDFGNQAIPGEISGSKWNDLDEDGEWDEDEPGLAGWTIYLDTNENGELDEDEVSTVTDEDGNYSFTDLEFGTYVVAEELQPNWVQTSPSGFPNEATQLTDNNFYEYSLQISGNNVVWFGEDQNYYRDVYFYDGETITQLTDNNFYEYSLQIDGDHVVWVGEDENYNSEVYFYNGETVTQLTDNDTYESSPQISGNNVVWSAWDGNDEEIFLYDGSEVIQLTDNDFSDYSPDIDGNNIVWSAYDGNDEEIFFYDGESITQLTDNNVYDYSPQISGNNIVWLGNNQNFYSDVYFYDGNTITQLTDDDFYEYSLQIDGDNVVWLGEDENYYSDVYFYDGEDVTQLTDDNFYESSPDIDGNNVVWSAYDGNNNEIFLYDGNSITQVTDNNIYDYNPQISGNNIVWSGEDEIYVIGEGNTHRVDLEPGTTVTDLNFGNHSLVTTINGTSENDELVGTPGPDVINGRQGNDKLFGLESDDTLNGGRGNDALFGGEGDDLLSGNRDNDQLYGEEGNDTLRGNSEDDILYGGEDNDLLVGGLGEDTLIGVDPNTPQAGVGEIDRLRGLGDSDLFVLGDEFTPYYNDNDDSNPGLEDYARIIDFTLGEDMIQLQGSPDNYVLDSSPFGQVNDTAIFLTTSDQNELIGIVRNVSLADLNLNDNTSFSFV